MARRQTDWVDTVVDLTIGSGSQANVSLVTGLAPVNLRGITLGRTLVRLTLNSATIAGAFGAQSVNAAIGVTSQEAFAAGVLPDPDVSGDKPSRGWIYRDHVGVGQNGVGSPVIFDMRADIRALRKLENGELFLIVTSDPVTGTAFTVECRGLVRALMILP